MGSERLDRARTVESIAAVPAPGRPPWAGAVLVRYPPRAVGLAAGAAVGLPGAPAGGRGELVFPAVDSGGRSVGAGRCNRPCVTGFGIAPARGHPAWTGFQQRLPAFLLLGVLVERQFEVIPLDDPTGGWRGHVWENYGRRIVDCATEAQRTGSEVECSFTVRRP